MPDKPPDHGTSMLELPMQTRTDVRLMPETAHEEKRTVELVWSTGAAVRRRDPWTGKRYDEVLSLEETHVDLGRLNGGAPLLNTHGGAFDLGDVIGVVERAWIAREGDGLVGRARVRFSDRTEVEPSGATSPPASSATSRSATRCATTRLPRPTASRRSGARSTGSRSSSRPSRSAPMPPPASAPGIQRPSPAGSSGTRPLSRTRTHP